MPLRLVGHHCAGSAFCPLLKSLFTSGASRPFRGTGERNVHSYVCKLLRQRKEGKNSIMLSDGAFVTEIQEVDAKDSIEHNSLQ